MSRLQRKNRTSKDINICYKGSLLDAVDNCIKAAYRINDEEYDFICNNASEYELNILTKNELSFIQKRKCIEILNKYLIQFKV